MKIAIISDVHSNLQALKAVLEEVKKEKVDKIFCLGDTVAKGTHPHECVELIKKNCDIVLKGNTDERFGTKWEDLSEFSELEQSRIKWNQSMLTEDDMEFLRTREVCFEFYMSGSLVRLFHATPYSIFKFVNVWNSFDMKYELFKPSEFTQSNDVADIVIYGHHHAQFMDRIYNRTIINVGSVGSATETITNPEKDGKAMETTQANFLILEGEYGTKEYAPISYKMCRVPYDIEKELEDVDLNLEKENYIQELRFGKYRDMEKVFKIYKQDGIDTSKI